MKNKTKQIKYYVGEDLHKKKTKIENTIDNLKIKYNKVEEQLNLMFDKHKDGFSKRIQRKIVKLSTNLTKLDVTIKRNIANLDKLNNGELEKLSPIENFKHWFSHVEYRKQTMIWGFIFIIPWVLGMAILFIPSVIETLFWSFSNANLTPDGMQTSFVGIENFKYLFTEYVIDGNNVFSVSLLTFIEGLIIDLPIIIIFSILIAVLLNKKFRGHTVIKAIFFVPVIYNLAVITETLTGTFGQHFAETMQGDITFVNQITGFFMQIGIGDSLLEIVLGAVDRIFTIVNLSGIQILIFVAAIQSIPNHLYEAAEIEGATKYEIFWKITIPMITPMILTAAVYTVVDSFTRSPITRFLQTSVANGNYGLAAAISISYFVINLVIVGIVFMLFKGKVFYHDEK